MLKMNSVYKSDAKQVSQSPVTTGSSVIGVAFDGGVVIGADVLASYGSLARFRDVSRVSRVNDNTVIGCGGDYADFQFLLKSIEQKMIENDNHNDEHILSPNALYSWLTRVHYNRRSKFDPFWCQWVIGGLNEEGKPFLGYVDKLGTAYECPIIATGYGAYIATPLMREELDSREGKLTEAEAIQLVEKCLTVLYYRDARSLNKYELAVVNSTGARIDGPLTLQSNWNVAQYVSGYE